MRIYTIAPFSTGTVSYQGYYTSAGTKINSVLMSGCDVENPEAVCKAGVSIDITGASAVLTIDKLYYSGNAQYTGLIEYGAQ